ncbi:MAG: hypothetical protein AB7L09_15455 [Nitrospira sp.]
MEDDVLQDMVDRAFLKQLGRAYRTDPKTGEPIDSIAQIEHDFKDLFGDGKD